MKPPKAQFVNMNTSASNPGRLPVQFLAWARCFPKDSVPPLCAIAAAIVLGVGLGIFVEHIYGPIIGVIIAVRPVQILRRRFTYMKEKFYYGCANPGRVISTNPYLVAVLTDLTKTAAYDFPVVKILAQPLERAKGRFKVGDGVATVALYQDRNRSLPHWADFHPVVANCVTDDQKAVARLFQTLDQAEDWQMLDSFIAQFPPPYRPGLYWLSQPSSQSPPNNAPAPSPSS